MSNIKTFRDIEQEGSTPTRSSSVSSLYSPLTVSNSSSSSPPPLFSFGFRNQDGSMRSVNCLEAFFPGFKTKSFIFILTIVQIVMFIATWLASKIINDTDEGFTCVLYQSGAKFTPAITTFHQVYRLLTPIFLHNDLGHIFFNMLTQSLYGYRLEAMYGTKRIAIFYLLAGIGGNLLSAVKFPIGISVGASSSLFGIIALYIAYILENFHTFGANKQNAMISLFILTIVVLGNVQSAHSKENGTNTENDNIDNYAHLGGFAAGVLMAIVYMVKFSYRKYYLIRIVAAVLLAAYFITTGVLLANSGDLEGLAMWMSQECQKALS